MFLHMSVADSETKILNDPFSLQNLKLVAVDVTGAVKISRSEL